MSEKIFMRVNPPQHFQTPNDLVDHWLPHLGKAELKILLVVMRKTFGWHKETDRISISQFEKITGLARPNAVRAVKCLVDKGVLLKEISGTLGNEEAHYRLAVQDSLNNFNESQKRPPPSFETKLPPSFETKPGGVSKRNPQKTSITKDIYIKQQQQPVQAAPAAAVFFKCLKDVEMPEKDKVWISQNYSEAVVEKAVKWATHPLTKIKKTLQQAIKWACEHSPDLPVDSKETKKKNRDHAEEAQQRLESKTHKIEILNKSVLVTPFAQGKEIAIDYTENGFKEQLESALLKTGFKKKSR
jgi:phage replication O-like protein O